MALMLLTFCYPEGTLPVFLHAGTAEFRFLIGGFFLIPIITTLNNSKMSENLTGWTVWKFMNKQEFGYVCPK